MKYAFVFPGQGAQYVGMLNEFIERYPVAKLTFEEANEALGFDLLDLTLNGPEEKLRLTYNTQPALLTASIAALRVFREQSDVTPSVVAGHSLGEYTALVASNALAFGDAVRLVHLRGKWMDEAVPAGTGAMTAILGLDVEATEQVCVQAREQSGEVVELANLNCPGQLVISGTKAAVDVANEIAKTNGARRVIPLVVSGPFHSSLMKPAAQKLEDALRNVSFADASVPVVANVDARLYTEAASFVDVLVRQLYSPVRFEEDVRTMLSAGVEGFIEFGPGTVLSGLIKKVERRIPTLHVEDEASLRQALEAISTPGGEV